MGALAGFSYREIVKRLKQLGLEFHRHGIRVRLDFPLADISFFAAAPQAAARRGGPALQPCS